MFQMIQNLTTGQKLYWGALALSTLGGGVYAYKIGAGELAQMVQDNKMLVASAALIGAFPLYAPYLAKAHSMLPQPMQLGAIHMNGMHMNGVALGALAMRNNPLAVRNPLSFSGVHAMNGIHM